jgi:hypothetical protein
MANSTAASRMRRVARRGRACGAAHACHRWTPSPRDVNRIGVLALAPHTATPGDGWNLSAVADRTTAGDLHLRYVLHGPVDMIRLPRAGAISRGDRLWEHTCAEAFVAAEGASAYVELNFCPSRTWAAYAFTAYRERAPVAPNPAEPRIVTRREQDSLALEALVALTDLSPAYRDAVLRVGLAMVIEATDGRLSYWALHHPSAQPDFHHPDGFTIRLSASAP